MADPLVPGDLLSDSDRPATRLVLIAVDGLSARWVGALGNTSAPTPGLDRLAVEGMVFHTVTADDLTGDGAWPTLLGCVSAASPTESADTPGLHDDGTPRGWIERLTADGRLTVLIDGVGLGPDIHQAFASVVVLADELFDRPVWYAVDDEPAVPSRTDHPTEEDVFDEPVPPEEGVATSWDEMVLVQTLSVAREIIAETPPDAVIVLAVSGLRGPWDVPIEDRNARRDDDDPEAYRGLRPPIATLDRIADADTILSYELTATALVAAFDDAVADFADGLAEMGLLEETMLAVTAPRGYALGEQGFVGPPERAPCPRAESYHVPLVIRPPHPVPTSGEESLDDNRSQDERSPDERSPRERAPVWLIGWRDPIATSDIGPLLVSMLDAEPLGDALATGADGSNAAERWLAQSVPSRPILPIRHERGTLYRTPVWLFDPGVPASEADGTRISTDRTSSRSLFVKPDDRYDVNDVADRARDVVEAFAFILARTPPGETVTMTPPPAENLDATRNEHRLERAAPDDSEHDNTKIDDAEDTGFDERTIWRLLVERLE